MLIVVVWWLWMLVMGLAALPLAYRFFRALPGRGYALARPLGLLLSAYVLWLGGSLGLLRNSLGGALFSLALVAALSAVVYWRGRSAEDPGLLAWLRANGRLVLSVELLYAGALGLWSLLRAYSPDLTTAGGEKFMEIMYLNSIGRSEYFPPHDAWLSGYAISYYYFGYVMTALLTLLSGFPAHLTFNVAVANLFALTCIAAFGLVYDLVKAHGLGAWQGAGHGVAQGAGQGAGFQERPTRPTLWGLLGTVLVAILGNLQGFLEVLYSLRLLPVAFWQWLDIMEINQPFDPGLAPSLMPSRSGWWWWRSSRVIHDLDPAGNSMGIQPIDEFPAFSFLLGDMHPHVLALPFVLLALAVALQVLLKERADAVDTATDAGVAADTAAAQDAAGARWLEPVRRLPLLVPLSLGALGFLNTWDFPIYWLIFVVAYGLGRWGRYGAWNRGFLRDVGLTGAAAGILGFLFYLPFYIGFQSQAGGILPTLYVGTRFRQYFVMFGPFLVAIAGLLAFLALRLKGTAGGQRLLRSWASWTALYLLGPFALMILVVLGMVLLPQGREFLEGIRRIPAVYEVVGDDPWLAVLGRLLLVKLRTWLMPLLVALLAALGTTLLFRSTAPPGGPNRGGQSRSIHSLHRGEEGRGEGGNLAPSLQFILVCAVVALLLTLSVEFFYLIDVFRMRMNTVFKFYFQAWVLMAVASAFATYWLGRQRGRPWLRRGTLLGFWLLMALGLVFPVLGNISRAGNFAQAPNLDGTAYLAQGQADDYAAIAWLNEHVAGAPVILEAPGTGGSSYVYEGRVSALTGLPTLLGWAGHENQWRGSYEVQNAREPDIQTIYNTLDPETARALLEENNVTYVYVGPLERTTYDGRALDKFGRFMDVVYQNEGVTIYKMRR